MKSLFKIPELIILIILITFAYLLIGLFPQIQSTEIITPSNVLTILIGSFLISVFIAMIAVIAGIGGGVIFTPILLGFTSIDTLIVRATGLVVAMFSGLISSGPFMRSKMADLRVVFYCGLPLTVGAFIGSISAIYFHNVMGVVGDGVVRLSLGVLMIVLAYFLFNGGGKMEYPQVKSIDYFSSKVGLKNFYWEKSLGKMVDYHLVNVIPGGFIFILLGFMGGFFGIGGGAFITATLNLVMMAPVKIAAACSGVLLAIGNSVAIWPYIMYGALIPLFVAPWMLGQIIGGILGAHILRNIKAIFVRDVLICILLLTSIKLISKGIEGVFGINIPII